MTFFLARFPEKIKDYFGEEFPILIIVRGVDTGVIKKICNLTNIFTKFPQCMLSSQIIKVLIRATGQSVLNLKRHFY